MTIERETKLGVWPGFTMPALTGLAENATVEHRPALRLDAAYHDTQSLALARVGITLRFRTGDDGGDRWTLKLPKGMRGSALVRDEIDANGKAANVPAEIRDHLVAWVRSAEIVQVARLQTTRQRAVVRDDEGKQLVEVVDDEVSVYEGRHVALRFREVEVEFAEHATDSLVEEVIARLRAAGAGLPDPTPKVIRALGPRALAPADVVVPVVSDDASAADVLRAGIAKAVLRVLEHDAGVRLTEDDEAVHQARVGTRRLRSDLRTFGTLVDPKWSEPLRRELSWFAELLGGVRDADVLSMRLAGEIVELGDDAPHGAALLDVLAAQRATARVALVRAMKGKRYVNLLDRLVDAANDPRILPEAAKPASEVLPKLVAGPWDALVKSVKKGGDHPSDDDLHAIRIRAKRARYAADVAALVVGKPAERFASALADVQDLLGDHHDAFVRREWLRSALGAVEPDSAFVAGRLLERAGRVADDRREEWHKAWKQMNEGRLRTWLNR